MNTNKLEVIVAVCNQIKSTMDMMICAVSDIERLKQLDIDYSFEDTATGIVFDELEHSQILTLTLTQLLTVEEKEIKTDGDGAFFEGELTAKKEAPKHEEEEK